MRMSDWSSDVCSSDLIGRAHREYPGRARLSRRGVRLRLRHSTDLLEERLHHEPLQPSASVRPPRMGWRSGCGLHQAARSEEHTSELQSLMRISYAVFCLKKKKRKKHINSNRYTTHRHKYEHNKTHVLMQ